MNYSIRVLVLIVVASSLGSVASAQTYPSKPVRMIVPFPPGGGTDYTARLIGQKLSELWGQPVVIENRPGASTIIGSDLVAKSAPDGYSLLMGSTNHTINPSLIPKLPYDTVKDFAPVTVCVTSAYVLVVHPSLPVKSVKELIALARARKGEINYSSSGTSGPQHIAGELFKMMAKVDMTHVPYKGGGPAVVALLGGHVQVQFSTPVSALPHVKTGKLRALAVTSLKRSDAVPELPTVAEADVIAEVGGADGNGGTAGGHAPILIGGVRARCAARASEGAPFAQRPMAAMAFDEPRAPSIDLDVGGFDDLRHRHDVLVDHCRELGRRASAGPDTLARELLQRVRLLQHLDHVRMDLVDDIA